LEPKAAFLLRETAGSQNAGIFEEAAVEPCVPQTERQQHVQKSALEIMVAALCGQDSRHRALDPTLPLAAAENMPIPWSNEK
jgi:hypothetical protein